MRFGLLAVAALLVAVQVFLIVIAPGPIVFAAAAFTVLMFFVTLGFVLNS